MAQSSSSFPFTRFLLAMGGLLLLAALALLWAASASNLASRLLLRLPVPDFSDLVFPFVTASIGCCWLWLTAIALGRRKSWARSSMLAIAVACLAIGIWLIGGTSLASLTSGSISRHLRLLYLIFIAAYAGLILLGLYWLVYFNLPRARALFRRRTLP